MDLMQKSVEKNEVATASALPVVPSGDKIGEAVKLQRHCPMHPIVSSRTSIGCRTFS